MKRELGIARCGLACCLCSENVKCGGCTSGECPDRDWCENRKCSLEKGLGHCYECEADCKKGLLAKIKPYAFTVFIRRYGEAELLDCLERNEQAGVVYHREGILGDYDEFDDVETLLRFIRTGEDKEYLKAKAMRRLMSEIQKGRESGEKEGWLSMDDVEVRLGTTNE